MDVLDSQAPSHARKTINLMKNRSFYGYFKARRQMTYTSRARNLHCLTKVSKKTIKNSIFEDFYGFGARRLIKSGRIIHKKCSQSKKLWFFVYTKRQFASRAITSANGNRRQQKALYRLHNPTCPKEGKLLPKICPPAFRVCRSE